MRAYNDLPGTNAPPVIRCCLGLVLVLGCGSAEGAPDGASSRASNALRVRCFGNRVTASDGSSQVIKSPCTLTHNADGTCSITCPPPDGGGATGGVSAYSLESHNQSHRLD